MTVAGSSVIGTKARSHRVEEIGGFGADPPDSEGKALGVVSLGGDHTWGGHGLLVCNFPLKRDGSHFSIYLSMNVLYYCFKNLMK